MTIRKLRTISSWLALAGLPVLGIACGGGSATGSPSDLTATSASFEQVDLTWKDHADGETGYYIERRDLKEEGASFIQVGKAKANETKFSDKDVTEDSTLAYRVLAYKGNSKGDPSKEAEVVTPAQKFPDLGSTNLVKLHLFKGSATPPDCFTCHGHMMYRRTLKSSIKEIHRRMIPATPGYDKTKQGWDGLETKVCTHCHQGVDRVGDSAAAARKQVSPATCAACHGPTPVGEGALTLYLSAP